MEYLGRYVATSIIGFCFILMADSQFNAFDMSVSIVPNPVTESTSHVTLTCHFAVNNSNFDRLFWMKGSNLEVVYYLLAGDPGQIETAYQYLFVSDNTTLQPSVTVDNPSTWSSHQLVINPTQCDADRYQCRVTNTAGDKSERLETLAFTVQSVDLVFNDECLGDTCVSKIVRLHNASTTYTITCAYTGMPYSPTTKEVTITPSNGASYALTSEDSPVEDTSLCEWSGKLYYEVTFSDVGEYTLKCDIMGNTREGTLIINSGDEMPVTNVLIYSAVGVVAIIIVASIVVFLLCPKESAGRIERKCCGP